MKLMEGTYKWHIVHPDQNWDDKLFAVCGQYYMLGVPTYETDKVKLILDASDVCKNCKRGFNESLS